MATDIDTQDVDLENNEEKGSKAKTQDDKPDWETKHKEALAEAAKWKRIAERNAKKADASDEEPKPTKSAKDEPSDILDNSQKALLRAMGIKGADELQLAREHLKRTGMDIDALDSDEYFQHKLEKLRTTKANEAAAAGGANRGTVGAAGGTAEFWLAKLGPNDPIPADLPRELKQEIVKARRAKNGKAGMFYND